MNNTERNFANVDSFLVPAGSLDDVVSAKKRNGEHELMQRPLLSFEKIKNIDASLRTLRVASGYQAQTAPGAQACNFELNQQQDNATAGKDQPETSQSASLIKNELSQGISHSKK